MGIAVLPLRDSKETRKLKKNVTRRDSEPSVGKYLPFGFARPLSWVKGKRNANEGASADAAAWEQQRIQDPNDAQITAHAISRDSTPPPHHITSATAQSKSSFSPYQRTTPTQSAPNIHLQDHSPTSLQPSPRNPSPAFSTTSSLIFPGREITPAAYFARTNRPRKNLQPRQLTPPPGLEPEKDPYMWLAWDRGRKRQQDKTDRILGGKDSSLHRQDSGNASWYDGFQKMMKEEEAKATKEEKKARKKEEKVRKREEKEERIRKEGREKEERIRKENEVREALRKKGDFAGGYLPRYV
ncbi:hypothetical protein J4E93_009753 [Alternaria ventricosa]|uniref:uncharacterized protein n=1 Tax=Alternaria ventricosa TaxID=1187951 RepID=UPI0020C3EED5|nr:uncharacterized protein J4E93_009753 [Alternaria ventricosa]KAI4638725.1 hypothetical protein J4E93_009753 [Alternaria ventricosa]